MVRVRSSRCFSRSSDWIAERLRSQRYPLVYYLIGANVSVFLLYKFGGSGRRLVMDLLPFYSDQPRVLSLVSYSFTHCESFHLLFNMFTLYFFGKHIEALFGPHRVLWLYLLGAVGGGLMHLFTSSRSRRQVLIGASGADSALASFFIVNFPYEKMFIFPLPFAVPAWSVGVGLLAYSTLMLPVNSSNVSHSAHLGGFLSGIGYYYFLRRRF